MNEHQLQPARRRPPPLEKHAYKVPLVLADTSSIMNLLQLELHHNYDMPHNADHYAAQPMRQLFDTLLQGDRTLVLTRQHLIELISTAQGKIDLEKLPDGTLRLPTVMHPHHFYGWHPRSAPIYYLLQAYQEEGKLRCYPSVDAMFEAHEAESPRGGIVIVDTENRSKYWEGGHKVESSKIPQHPPHMKGREEKEEDRKKTQSFYQNAGDTCMIYLCDRLLQRAHERKTSCGFAILAEDGGIHQTLSRKIFPRIADGHQYPTVFNSQILLNGVAEHTQVGDGFDIASADAYTAAAVRRSDQWRYGKRLIEGDAREKYFYDRDMRHFTNWFNDTRLDPNDYDSSKASRADRPTERGR